mmetsp:Transcript_3657/g.5962  ORF Transcript_3657/g.5962 Transcript_3657/m.5962 type:complete len:241 (-) Transcript_3657:25-747(-)
MSHDKYITTFSPDGRLYQVEYAFKAIKAAGDTSLGVRGKNAVAIITQKKVEDKLIDPSTITRVFRINKYIGCVITGLLADARLQAKRLRQEASEFRYKFGYDVPVSYLARRLGDLNQLFTQHAASRVLAASVILIAQDPESGPELWKIDPAGSCLGWRGASSGEKESEADALLEKRLKKSTPDNEKETVQFAIAALQSVLSADFKADEVEVAVASVTNPKFRTLNEAEIDAHLTEIAERD